MHIQGHLKSLKLIQESGLSYLELYPLQCSSYFTPKYSQTKPLCDLKLQEAAALGSPVTYASSSIPQNQSSSPYNSKFETFS